MPLTAEETKAITDQITASLTGENGTVTKVIGDVVRKIVPGMLTDNLTAALKPIQDSLAEFKKAPPTPDPKSGDPKPPSHEKDPQILALEARIKAAEDERNQERESAMAARVRAAFMQQWAGKGLQGGDFAYSRYAPVLTEPNPGAPVTIKVQRELAGQKFEEQVGIGEWIEEFAKSDEGKMFVPAAGIAGAGGGAGEQVFQRSGHKLTKEDVLRAAVNGGNF